MRHPTLLPRHQRALILSILLGLSALLTPGSLRAAGVIYVIPGGAGTQTGADWASAKDLQAALQSALSGDQIWIKAGVYKPTIGSNRSAAFQLRSGVALYGGFAGSESELSQRDTTKNVTILSGDLLENDLGEVNVANPTRSDNSYHVVVANSVDASAILDGFTIAAGNANLLSDSGITNAEGGGLRNNQGSPTISHVTFLANSAIWSGGMVNNTPSSPLLSQVAFIGNMAEQGGGGLTNYGSNPTITQAIFSGNVAAECSAMVNYISDPVISQSTFSGNISRIPNAGGAMCNVYLTNHPVVRNSIFWGNIGGEISAYQGAGDVQNTLVQGGYISGTHILDADPLFTDADGADNIAGTLDDDLRLQAGSPAIDAGNNAFIPPDLTDENNNTDFSEAAPFDLDGNQRLVNITVDLGAYERQMLTITSPPPAATATYGAIYSHTFTTNSDSGATFTVTSGTLPPGLTLTSNGVLSGTPSMAGTYGGISVAVSSASGSVPQAFTIVVHRAPLTIAADNKVKLAGAATPALTASYSGFVLGDTPASLDAPPSLATTATIASPPGSYPIIASGAADANYDISFASGTLTITSQHTYIALVSR